MNLELGFIYGLQHPTTKEIFYVGATTRDLDQRLKSHYQHLRELEKGTRKSNRRLEYLKQLLPLKANIINLESIYDLSIIEQREQYWIELHQKLNSNLTNMTDGGKGQCTSKYYTEEELKEYGNKISNANKGKPKPIGFAEHLSVTRQGINNPAVKPINNGGIVGTKDKVSFIWFKYGFEVNNYFSNNHAYGNVYRTVNKKDNCSKKPYGYEFKFYDEISDDTKTKLKRASDLIILNNV